jgi:transcriptional regulator with XRE-family HTH domain
MTRKLSVPALGPRIQAIRKRHRLSLDELARKSGVSKSMLSQVERGEANPTFATLWNLTRALDVEFSELVEAKAGAAAAAIDVTSQNHIPEIRTEDGRCVLRILSPPGSAGAMEWYELSVAPSGALISKPHARGAMEHLTVIKGSLSIMSGDGREKLSAGDTARYAADIPHAIRNDGKTEAKAFLVVIGGLR